MDSINQLQQAEFSILQNESPYKERHAAWQSTEKNLEWRLQLSFSEGYSDLYTHLFINHMPGSNSRGQNYSSENNNAWIRNLQKICGKDFGAGLLNGIMKRHIYEQPQWMEGCTSQPDPGSRVYM